jgi:bifunctional oligoribonuclease and PAP phosphatase NrnA
VFTKEEAETVYNNIFEAENVLILTHDFPDGDALGSLLAFCAFFEKIKKNYKYCLTNYDRDFWENIFTLYSDKEIFVNNINIKDYDFVIVLDSSNINRLNNELQSVVTGIDKILNIDHHGDNNLFGTTNIVKEAVATGEVLYNLFSAMNQDLNHIIAQNLLTSIISDSGRFKYSNTHKGIFRITEKLVNICGEDVYHNIVNCLYEEQPFEKMQLMSRVIQNLEFLSDKVSFSYIEEDVGFTEGLIENIRAIKGIKISIFARIVDQKIKISFRSKDKNISIRELAEQFGGGGHPGASGATIQLYDFFKQINEIKETCKSFSEKIL